MLEIKNLSKTYKGSIKPALDDVSFRIHEGEFVALLGQNGAGKSTLINILGGNVKKNTGMVRIGGLDLDTHELDTKKLMGIVPQEINFDFTFSSEEILRNQSGFFGIPGNTKYIRQLLSDLSLLEKGKTRSFKLSGGMKRRLLIAKALVHRPKLLILDEPTAGVDIELRHTLYDSLRKLHKAGTTIILTTHYLEEAEKLCDRILVIAEGKLLVDEQKRALMKRLGTKTTLEFNFNQQISPSDFDFLTQQSLEVEGNNTLKLQVPHTDIGHVFQELTTRSIAYDSCKVEPQKLEDVFLQLVGGARL
jgi:ABC-2 type transport system ATP-binding protein